MDPSFNFVDLSEPPRLVFPGQERRWPTAPKRVNPGPKLSSKEERDAARLEFLRKVRDACNAETPFFSKAAIQDFVRQVAQIKPMVKGQMISLRTIDGERVDFQAEIGTLDTTSRPYRNTEHIYNGFDVRFETHQHLIKHQFRDYDVPGDEYRPLPLPLQLNPLLTSRDTATGEFHRPPPGIPYEEMKPKLEAHIANFQSSHIFAQLKRLFLDMVRAPVIKRIVTFALGPFCDDVGYDRMMTQHGLAISLAALFDVECVCQDILYSGTDEKLLRDKGVRVVKNPAGFLEVDDETLVVSICADVATRAIVADTARPAAMIWDRVTFGASESLSTRFLYSMSDSETPRLWEMVRNDYYSVQFPNDGENFIDLGIYIRAS